MTENEKDITVEMERIKLERLKIYGKILTVAITVGFGTFGVTLINSSYQNRQLDQQKHMDDANISLQDSKAKAEQRQSEMENLGKFVEYALEDDARKRLRFSKYFATLTLSEELNKKWNEYHDQLQKTIKEKEDVSEELSKAIDSRNESEIRKRKAQHEQLMLKLEPIREQTDTDETFKDEITGLEWFAGPDRDTTWEEAKSWVKDLTDLGGWRMPKIKELRFLFKKRTGTRNMPRLLKTTGWWVWSGETEAGTGLPLLLNFESGKSGPGGMSFRAAGRGFAVRPLSDG